MKEIIVISGKGGTGKTSIVASFASLAKNAILADCDVDAADLYLLLTPDIKQRQDFCGGQRARIETKKCSGCGFCTEVCRFDAVIENTGNGNACSYSIDPLACEGCGVCHYFCPDSAIIMDKPINGELYISEMRYGPMVHAKLGIAEENSGKLVALVRKSSREIAEKCSLDYLIVDGPPGLGCPVISSITGSDLVLIVTEPTLSGLSDLKRVKKLADHFTIKSTVCINKWDINPDITNTIIEYCNDNKIRIVGKVHYNNEFTGAQIAGRTIIETSQGELKKEITSLWDNVRNELLHEIINYSNCRL